MHPPLAWRPDGGCWGAFVGRQRRAGRRAAEHARLQRQGHRGGLARAQQRPRAHARPTLRALHPRGDRARTERRRRPVRRRPSARRCAGTALRTRSRSPPSTTSSKPAPADRATARRPPTWRASPTTPTTSTWCSPKGTFSQSFDLWTLSRVPPSPAVLYRDPTQTSLTGTAAGPTTLSLSNPSDGFTSSADVTLQSATLGFFAPSGTTLSPSPDQAVLSVVLDGEFPNNPNDPAGSGHYLGGKAPLPASMLSFTPNGAGRGAGHDQRRRRHHRQGQLRRRPLRRHLLVPRPGHASRRAPSGSPQVRSPGRSSRSIPPRPAPPRSTSAPRRPWRSASRPPSPRPPSAPRRGSASPIPRRARRRRAHWARTARVVRIPLRVSRSGWRSWSWPWRPGRRALRALAP